MSEIKKEKNQSIRDFCPICSTAEEKIYNSILNILVKKNYPKNTLIYSQSDEATGLYLIEKGAVKTTRQTPQGKEVILSILGKSQTFGETSLFGQGLHTDTAITTENTQIYFLPRKDFNEILNKHPELYQSVITCICSVMDNLNSIIENINTASARDRVCSHLIKLKAEQSSDLVHLTGKKHEVALLLGLRPETFSRALTELESEGIISMNHKQIQILDSTRLKS